MISDLDIYRRFLCSRCFRWRTCYWFQGPEITRDQGIGEHVASMETCRLDAIGVEIAQFNDRLAASGCMKEALMPRSTRREGRGRRKADTPHPVDIHVGSRVRLRRIELGINQTKLAAELGLTFQQVQKYERATNRISASRLFHIGKVVGVKVAFFYEGYSDAGAPSGFAEPPAEAFQSDLLQRRDTIELCNAFYAIDDAALRRRLLDLAKTLATGGEPK